MNLSAGWMNPLASPRARRLRYLVAALTALFGAVASVGVFLMIGSWQYRVAEIGFENLARDRLRIMASDFKESSGLLYTLRAYIAASDAIGQPRRVHPVFGDAARWRRQPA